MTKQELGQRIEPAGLDKRASLPWRLSKIDIRSPVSPDAWPIARLELEHPQRGRVTDIGTAPGAFDAAFSAASLITGISARLISFDVRSGAPAGEGAMSIQLDIQLEIDGEVYAGSSFGVDLVRCSICAWLEAAQKSRPIGPASNDAPWRAYQVSGSDENDDLWIFASADEGAAEAIATEFRDEGHTNIRCFGQGTGMRGVNRFDLPRA